VAHDAAAVLEPGDDIHASADYRRHLAGVLAERVLQSAFDAARAAR
jgi:CO/xanthine dehydrogenase FAD-binding subunit